MAYTPTNRLRDYFDPAPAEVAGDGLSSYARVRIVRQVFPAGSVFVEVGSVVSVPRQWAEELARAGLAEILPERSVSA